MKKIIVLALVVLLLLSACTVHICQASSGLGRYGSFYILDNCAEYTLGDDWPRVTILVPHYLRTEYK